jgi:acyl-CoA reductase-like NAD-dependent aldehyde dehydrogenase
MLEAPLLINHQNLAAKHGATFERLNPITGQVSTRAAAASVEDALAAANGAVAAFAAWSETGPSARRVILNRAAELMMARSSDFTAAMAAETGATASWAQFNCHIAVHADVASEFVDKLGSKAASLKAGLPTDDRCALGSMIGADAAARVRALVDDAVAKGATLVAGGGVRNSIMQATVVDRAHHAVVRMQVNAAIVHDDLLPVKAVLANSL